MITTREAWRIVVAQTGPLPAIERDLEASLHYVLAQPVCADRDSPAADRSAMDGYAVRADDLGQVPATLPVCDEVAAGFPAERAVGPGESVRIFTGANMPPGADTVVMVEETELGADAGEERVTFLHPVTSGQNIFRQGENAREGDVLLPRGTVLTAGAIAACAAVGAATLSVFRKPTFSILCTGEELLDMRDQVGRHQLRDSNGPMLAAALQESSFELDRRRSVPDDIDATVAALDEALGRSDVVALTGGVSVGKYDFVPSAVEKVGGTVQFHGIAMKPGKPQLFATTAEGKCIFGLPGNPLSVMTGLHEFVLPAARRLSGVSPELCRFSMWVPLTTDIRLKGKRRRYIPGRLSRDGDAGSVEPVSSKGSADLVAGGKADGTIICPEGESELTAGTTVEFRPWRQLP